MPGIYGYFSRRQASEELSRQRLEQMLTGIAPRHPFVQKCFAAERLAVCQIEFAAAGMSSARSAQAAPAGTPGADGAVMLFLDGYLLDREELAREAGDRVAVTGTEPTGQETAPAAGWLDEELAAAAWASRGERALDCLEGTPDGTARRPAG